MLEGKNVNLRLIEKDDLTTRHEWVNNLEMGGIYNSLSQTTYQRMENRYTERNQSTQQPTGYSFFIELKDGTKVGSIGSWKDHGGKFYTMGAGVLPEHRRKGYTSEATMIMIDFLFLSDNIMRIQAMANTKNIGSIKTLEKAGLRKEGILRKYWFIYGKWADMVMLSILRDEWDHPKVLKLPVIS
jgi:ribosomal-protein-alanine N-acetyltransferase